MINELAAPKKIDEKYKNPRIAFDLGWDIAAAGLDVPYYAVGCESLVSGWKEATAKKIKVKVTADRFLTKHFQLRFNAWKRNRHFSDAVTPDFLAYIDTPFCPVTQVALTHGTGTATDASVDRLNNNGAYACGNLAVMSVRANAAKDKYSYHKIIRFAYSMDEEIPTAVEGGFEPLTRMEWARMASLCSNAPSVQHEDGTMEVSNWFTPCVACPAPGTLPSVPNQIQMGIAFLANLQKVCALGYSKSKRQAKYEAYVESMKKALLPNHRDNFNKLVHRAKKVTSDLNAPLTIWLNTALYGHFTEFYKLLTEEELAKLKVIASASGAVGHMDLTGQDLKLNNHGYEDGK